MKIFRNRTVVGVLCILLALLICFGVTPLFSRSASEKTEIVRVTADIKEGDEITAEMVQTVEVGAYNLPSGIMTDKDDVIGKYATADLKMGDYILDSKLSYEPAAENAYLYSLDGNKQAISVTIKSFATGLSGKLESGDIVSVLVADYKGMGETVIPPELQYVEVISVTASSGYDANTGEAVEDEKELPSIQSDKAGGYMKYIATREGVEKLSGNGPVTKGQRELIQKLLHDFPDAAELFEYEDYCKTPTLGTASAFITMALDANLHEMNSESGYMSYIATRPRVERHGAHGLFSSAPAVDLNAAMSELEAHEGNVWTIIYSLRREDAARLEYDNADAWRTLLMMHTQDLARATALVMRDIGQPQHSITLFWKQPPKSCLIRAPSRSLWTLVDGKHEEVEKNYHSPKVIQMNHLNKVYLQFKYPV